MTKRIALLGIYHESNTFVKKLTTLTEFSKGHYIRGEDIRKEYQDAFHEIGGMIEVIDEAGMELVPLVFAEATPSGIISAETYNTLLADLMDSLEKALPLDGCLVVPHGAGVSEEFADMDGHWMSQVRAKLGKDIPVTGSLDLHANVSQLMVNSTDALVSYKKNPHVDQRETGKATARLLVDYVNGKIKPKQYLVQPPLAISIEQHFTDSEPCTSLYSYAKELSGGEGILSVSILLGFPYADVEEMGTSFIVVSDDQPELARSAAEQLQTYLLANSVNFTGKKNSIPLAMELIGKSEKPVLLLDMGDNVGGGSPGNSISLLEALEEQAVYKYFICIHDPEAVVEAAGYAENEVRNIVIKGTAGEEEKTFTLPVSLVKIVDGNFREDHARHGGQVNYKMGTTAIMKTGNGSVIMLTTLRIVPFSLSQLTTFGIAPETFDAIVAKGVIAPLAAYAPVCPTTVQVNTPGVTQADMTMFTYKNRRKPLFPFEKE